MAAEEVKVPAMTNAALQQALANMIEQKRKNANISDEQALKTAETLGKLSKNRRAAKRIAKNKGAIRQLMESVRSRPRFSKMVEYSVECLKNLAVDEVSTEEIIEEGALQLLLDVLKVNPFNEDIQRMVNKMLLQLCSINARVTGMVFEVFGTQNLLHSLSKHVDPETQVLTCQAVRRLMVDNAIADKFVDDGAIEALAAVIRNSRDPEVVAAAAATLARIAEDPKHAARIMASGVAEHVLAAMRAHPENVDLARSAVSLLGNLARGGPAIQEQLKALGAVEAIVAALELHPDDAELLRASAVALGSLTSKIEVGDALGKVMSGTTATDKASALATVGSLALVEENVAYIVETGGVPAILGVMASVSADKSESACRLLESGCRSLERLAVNESNIYTIMREGGVRVVTALLQSHAGNERVVGAGIGALVKMATRKENCEYLVKSGALAAAIAAFRANPDATRVARALIDLVQAICAHEEVVERAVAAGAIDAILDIVRNHKDDPALMAAAINALGRMAVSEENIAAIRDRGGFELLIDVLRNHVEDAELVQQALLLLETAALIPANLERLRKLGAIEAILHASEVHPQHSGIQETAARALGLFASQDQIVAIIGNVSALADQLKKERSQAVVVQIETRITPAVNMLGNLAQVQENHTFLRERGAVKAIVAAFEEARRQAEHKERNALLEASARALARLVVANATALQAVQTGALQLVLDTALANPSLDQLAEHAALMAELCASFEACLPDMVKQGVVGKLLALAEAHPLSAAQLANTARCFGYLAAVPEAAAEILRRNGAALVCESVTNALGSPNDLAMALTVIANLAADEAAAKALVDAGAIEAVLAALRAYPENADVVLAALKALGRLAQTEEIARLMGEKGVLPLILRALRDHADSPEIVETALILLDSLGLVPANALLLYGGDLGGAEAVRAAGERHPEHATIQEMLRNCLATAATVARPQEAKAAEAQLVDGAALAVQMLGAGLSPVDMRRLLSQVEAVVRLEDPSAAKAFVANGGLEATGRIMMGNVRVEDVFKAGALACTALAAHQAQVLGPEGLARVSAPAAVEALVEMLRPHDKFASQVGMEALIASCQLLASAAPTQVTPAMLDTVLQVLARATDPKLLEAAARVLAKFSNNEALLRVLATEANLHMLLELMRKHKANAEFIRYALVLLGNMAGVEALKALIGQLGGIQLIIELMVLHAAHEGVVENCNFALANLSFSNEGNNALIVACDGITHVINSMRAHRSAEDLLESATVVLSNLCFRNDRNKEVIVAKGGAKAVVDCVLSHFQNASLLTTGFRALGNFAYFEPNVRRIIEEGAVQGIVAGITVHARDVDIVSLGVTVLTNLTSNLDAQLMNIVAEEGAVQAVVEATVNHMQNVDVQTATLSCLCNLATAEYNSAMIVKQGGTAHIVQVTAFLDFESEVLAKAASLFRTLATAPSNAQRMIADGVAAGLDQIMGKEQQNAPLLIECLRCVALLSTVADNARALGESRVIVVAVIRALTAHLANGALVKEAVRALTNLSRSEPTAAAMALAAMQSLEALLLRTSDASVVEFCVSFLANLALHPSAAVRVSETRLVSAVIDCAGRFVAIAHVVHKCLKALENLLRADPSVRTHMQAVAAAAQLEAVRMRTADADLKKAIEALIYLINFSDDDEERKRAFRSARLLLDDEEDEVAPEITELSEATRNFLVAGALLQKHSNTAMPRPRHVYVSDDFKWLYWRDTKKAVDDETPCMKITKIRAVEKGRATPQLKRKHWGKFLAREECCFAVMGRERTVDLEAPNEVERDKWVRALSEWVAWHKAMRKAATKF